MRYGQLVTSLFSSLSSYPHQQQHPHYHCSSSLEVIIITLDLVSRKRHQQHQQHQHQQQHRHILDLDLSALFVCSPAGLLSFNSRCFFLLRESRRSLFVSQLFVLLVCQQFVFGWLFLHFWICFCFEFVNCCVPAMLDGFTASESCVLYIRHMLL
jgi:hypothetical protein